ncbi:cullin family domain-containing protein [Phthorimaea operculella]|nr:cullin family domain-containing protein [Phthorimaea operculella]
MMSLKPRNVDFQETWANLKETVAGVVGLKPVERCVWNTRFSDVYALCVAHPEPLADKLYDETRNFLEEHVSGLLQRVRGSAPLENNDHNDGLLDRYVTAWHEYSQGVAYLNSLYSYLNLQHVKRQKVSDAEIIYGSAATVTCPEHDSRQLEVGELGLVIWERVLIRPLSRALSSRIVSALSYARTNAMDPRRADIVRAAIQSTVEVQSFRVRSPLALYQELVLEPYLESAGRHHAEFAASLLQNGDISHYMEHVLEGLEKEIALGNRFLHSSSTEAVRGCYERCAVAAHLPTLHGDTERLLREACEDTPTAPQRRQDLARMYTLLKPLSTGAGGAGGALKPLVEAAHTQAAREGYALLAAKHNKDEAHTHFVNAMLTLHGKYSKLFTEVFNGAQAFVGALDKACSLVVNSVPATGSEGSASGVARAPELLARYCDCLLRRRAATDTDTDEKLAAAIVVFKKGRSKDERGETARIIGENCGSSVVNSVPATGSEGSASGVARAPELLARYCDCLLRRRAATDTDTDEKLAAAIVVFKGRSKDERGETARIIGENCGSSVVNSVPATGSEGSASGVARAPELLARYCDCLLRRRAATDTDTDEKLAAAIVVFKGRSKDERGETARIIGENCGSSVVNSVPATGSEGSASGVARAPELLARYCDCLLRRRAATDTDTDEKLAAAIVVFKGRSKDERGETARIIGENCGSSVVNSVPATGSEGSASGVARAPELLARYCDCLLRRRAATDTDTDEKLAAAIVVFKLLARYCDCLLRRRAATDTDTDEKLAAAIVVFKYVDDKDVFQKYYARALARRLIHQLSASMEQEEAMINRLKAACGYEFTNKLHRMFTDVAVSADLNAKFQAHLRETGQNCGAGFCVQVLQAGAWPLGGAMAPLAPPAQLEKPARLFEAFYRSSFSGRRLAWLHHLCTGELRTRYTHRMYHISATTPQCALLLCFEKTDSTSAKELRDTLQLSGDSWTRHMRPLIDAGLLTAQAYETPHRRGITYCSGTYLYWLYNTTSAKELRDTLQLSGDWTRHMRPHRGITYCSGTYLYWLYNTTSAKELRDTLQLSGDSWTRHMRPLIDAGLLTAQAYETPHRRGITYCSGTYLYWLYNTTSAKELRDTLQLSGDSWTRHMRPLIDAGLLTAQAYETPHRRGITYCSGTYLYWLYNTTSAKELRDTLQLSGDWTRHMRPLIDAGLLTAQAYETPHRRGITYCSGTYLYWLYNTTSAKELRDTLQLSGDSWTRHMRPLIDAGLLTAQPNCIEQQLFNTSQLNSKQAALKS